MSSSSSIIKRGGLALYSSSKLVRSHYIRLVSYTKDLEIEYVELEADSIPQEFLDEVNSTGRLPTLTDRDLVLFDERVISEYMDERFPHPALMPIEANNRAKIRLFFWELEKAWYSCVDTLEQTRQTPVKRRRTQRELRDAILSFVPFFKGREYLIGNELSLLDCFVLPVLWRLGALEIELPKSASPLLRYMDFHFNKDYFRKSLSKYEEALPPYVVS